MVTGLVGNNIILQIHTIKHSVTSVLHYQTVTDIVCTSIQYDTLQYFTDYRSQEILLSFDVCCNSLLVDQLRSKPEQEKNHYDEITVALYIVHSNR